ncbi:glucosyl-3-phosphoglycerate/mannosyl-3-phosphoglycerate phosphatase [bacterium BMS3Abin10]|nr:glucosyl-3-phosphoglycerate/mannosyl-3-phosphoglycerate phosphatase [bacterium BMS3Abin10]
MKKQLIIFTDLDGTLLDSKYSFDKARPALALIKKNRIPLVLCTSKTQAEIELLRKKLRNTHPFISENGGGVFIPKDYFKIKIANCKPCLPAGRLQIAESRKYYIIKLGTEYSVLRKALKELRTRGFDVKGFGDMTVREVARLTGLKTADAKLAKQRDFDEPFVFKGSAASLKKLKQFIKSIGLTFTIGEFFHLMGNGDKGRAVKILTKLYRKQYGKITTIALGDSPNDTEMFEIVDYPIMIRKPGGSYDKRIKVKKKLIRADGAGPEGWNIAVKNLLNKFF